MDRHQRLNMLFEGDDNLLKLDTRLNPTTGPEVPVPSEKAKPTQPQPTTTASTSTRTAVPKMNVSQVQDDDSDEEGFDEYLSSFSQAAHRATLKPTKKDRQRNNTSRGKSESTTSDSGLTLSEVLASLPVQEGDGFCPLVAVSRFPYKYIRGHDADRIAKRFFDGGKFWDRVWDIYYIHPPLSVSNAPLLLVPSSQVQVLIDSINEAFRCHLFIPSDPNLGFLIHFTDDGTPQPQFLGRSTSREDKSVMEAAIPLPTIGHHCEPPEGCSPAVDRAFAAFKAKIEAAVEATKRKSKASKAKKQQDGILKLQEWCRSLKRTQCYLGLRPRRPRDIEPPSMQEGLSWEERKKAEREYGLACGTILLPFDVTQPAPHAFASEPIFVCVDVEANERCHNQVTEIGISTLDTLDLIGIPPGENGCNWISKIRSRHFRISERSYIINKDYVGGCPENFEFGESEWVSIRQVVDVVDSCFKPPYSGHIDFSSRKTTGQAPHADSNGETVAQTTAGSHNLGHEERTDLSLSDVTNKPSDDTIAEPQGCSKDADEAPACSSNEPALPGTFAGSSPPFELVQDYKQRRRNLIFVGHDAASDMTYLRNLGSKIFGSGKTPATNDTNKQETEQQPPYFLESIDTNILFRVLKRETQPSSLGKVLVDLGITGWFLHNAGNDARYTMEALISIALRSRLLLDTTHDYVSNGDQKSPSTHDWPLAACLSQGAFSPEEEAQRAANAYDRAWEAEIQRRVEAEAAQTAARVRDECASWNIALGLGGDGAADDVDGGDGKGIKN